MSSVRLSAGVGFSIGDIHDASQGFERSLSDLTIPATTSRERSWDFMSPDIIRPVATSTVGDIIALAHRLGMGWNKLRLGDGVMRAEGNGHSIVSITVRGYFSNLLTIPLVSYRTLRHGPVSPFPLPKLTSLVSGLYQVGPA